MGYQGQSVTLYYWAWDTANNCPKTGDAANHTIYVLKGGVASEATNSPAEVDDELQKGKYAITLTAAEYAAGVNVGIAGKSSTANIILICPLNSLQAQNTAFKVHYYAFNTDSNNWETGDNENHTLGYMAAGENNGLDDDSPAEVDDTDCPGVYSADVTTDECNFVKYGLGGVSSTSNVVLLMPLNSMQEDATAPSPEPDATVDAAIDGTTARFTLSAVPGDGDLDEIRVEYREKAETAAAWTRSDAWGSNAVGQTLDLTVTQGVEYVAHIVAIDTWGNETIGGHMEFRPRNPSSGSWTEADEAADASGWTEE